jgi:hypothetical protein
MERFSEFSAERDENVQRGTSSQSTEKKSIPRLALWLVGCSVLLHGVVSIWLGPMIYSDSVRYAPLGESTPDLDLLGTYGNGTPLVQIIWRLRPPLPLVIQAVASGAAWAFVTCIGLVVIRSRFLTTAWFAVLMVIFWSPLIVFADASILTESLAISGSLACLAGAFCLVNERARSTVPMRFLCVAMVAGFGVAVLSRPVTLVALAPTAFMTCVLAWRRSRQFALLISGIVILGIFVYGFILSANVARSPSEVFRAENRLELRASPQWIEAAKRTGFVDCPALPSSELISSAERAYVWYSIGPLKFRRLEHGSDSTLRVRERQCPGIIQWLEARHLTASEQLIYAPRDTMSGYMADGLRLWIERSLGVPPIPLWVQRTAPRVTLLFDMAAVALLAVVVFRTWRLRRFVSIPAWSWLLVGVTVSSWFVYSLVIWLADESEVGRHFLPIPVVLGPLALLAVAVLWPNDDGVYRPDD